MLGYKWISTKMVGSGGLDNVINVHRFSLKYYSELSACVAFGRCRGNVHCSQKIKSLPPRIAPNNPLQ